MSPCFIAATARSAASPMQSSAKLTGRLMMCATSAATGFSDCFGIAALRAAEMREQDHLGALVGDLGDGGRHALDAGGVGDHAVLHRHVEVDAHQHALALHVDVVEGAERVHDALGSVSVRSACPSPRRCRPCGWRSPIRCRTTTSRAPSVPSITLVWSMWKIDECGSWLKSIETFGCVGVAEDALELLLGGALDRAVDLVLGGRASWRRT